MIKSHKEKKKSQNSRNQGLEGVGSGFVSRINGSGSGSPYNKRILPRSRSATLVVFKETFSSKEIRVADPSSFHPDPDPAA